MNVGRDLSNEESVAGLGRVYIELACCALLAVQFPPWRHIAQAWQMFVIHNGGEFYILARGMGDEHLDGFQDVAS